MKKENFKVMTCRLTRRGSRPYLSLPEDCNFLVSVGKEHFQGNYLSSTLALINAEFKSCNIIVTGTLQRFNIATEKGVSLKDTYKGTLSKEAGAPSENVLETSDIEQITEKIRKIDLEHTSRKVVFTKSISSGGIAGAEDKDVLNAAYNEALAKENKFIEDVNLLISRLDKKCAFAVIPWDKYTTNEGFNKHLAEVNKLLNENKDMQIAMSKTVNEFYEKHNNKIEKSNIEEIFKQNSELFLKEECAAMFMWQGMVIYPSGASPILGEMSEYINKTLSLNENEQISWQALRFKQAEIKDFNEITSEKTEDFLDTAILQKPSISLEKLSTSSLLSKTIFYTNNAIQEDSFELDKLIDKISQINSMSQQLKITCALFDKIPYRNDLKAIISELLENQLEDLKTEISLLGGQIEPLKKELSSYHRLQVRNYSEPMSNSL